MLGRTSVLTGAAGPFYLFTRPVAKHHNPGVHLENNRAAQQRADSFVPYMALKTSFVSKIPPGGVLACLK